MIEVRRPADNELCGFVDEHHDGWRALTVFGGLLATFPDLESAREHVAGNGLASLAERWWYRSDPESDWQIVCIQEASPESVTLALDYYSTAGVPTITLGREDLLGSARLSMTPD